jgi:hypothetical protein
MARLSPEKWEEVKAAYCVGKRTNREIGEQFGVSHTAIQQRAEKEGWVKIDANIVDAAIDSRIEISKVSKTFQLESSHVNAQIDLHAQHKVKADNIGMMILDRTAELVRDCYDAGELQKLSAAHKNIYEGRFKQASTVINNTNAQQNIIAPEIV